MNQIWFGAEDETAFWEAIGQNVGPGLLEFVSQQVDLRFEGDTFYNLITALYETRSPTELLVQLGVTTEDLDAEDVINTRLTIITRPFKIKSIEGTAGAVVAISNYARLAAIPNSHVIRFTSDTTALDYWEFNPLEGVLLDRFPADMFIDTSIIWLERFRVTTGDLIHFNRGDSTASLQTLIDGYTDEAAIVIIDESTETYVMLQANDYSAAGANFLNYTPTTYTIIASEVGSADINAWMRDLVSREIVVAIIPTSTFRPSW